MNGNYQMKSSVDYNHKLLEGFMKVMKDQNFNI